MSTDNEHHAKTDKEVDAAVKAILGALEGQHSAIAVVALRLAETLIINEMIEDGDDE